MQADIRSKNYFRLPLIKRNLYISGSKIFLPKNILPRPTVRKLSYCAYFPPKPDNLRIFLQYIAPAHRIPKLIPKQYTFYPSQG